MARKLLYFLNGDCPCTFDFSPGLGFGEDNRLRFHFIWEMSPTQMLLIDEHGLVLKRWSLLLKRKPTRRRHEKKRSRYDSDERTLLVPSEELFHNFYCLLDEDGFLLPFISFSSIDQSEYDQLFLAVPSIPKIGDVLNTPRVPLPYPGETFSTCPVLRGVDLVSTVGRRLASSRHDFGFVMKQSAVSSGDLMGAADTQARKRERMEKERDALVERVENGQ